MKRALMRLLTGIALFGAGLYIVVLCGIALIGGPKEIVFHTVSLPLKYVGVLSIPFMHFGRKVIFRSIRYLGRRSVMGAVKCVSRASLGM